MQSSHGQTADHKSQTLIRFALSYPNKIICGLDDLVASTWGKKLSLSDVIAMKINRKLLLTRHTFESVFLKVAPRIQSVCSFSA